jgi:hypothetical protein
LLARSVVLAILAAALGAACARVDAPLEIDVPDEYAALFVAGEDAALVRKHAGTFQLLDRTRGATVSVDSGALAVGASELDVFIFYDDGEIAATIYHQPGRATGRACHSNEIVPPTAASCSAYGLETGSGHYSATSAGWIRTTPVGCDFGVLVVYGSCSAIFFPPFIDVPPG